MIGALPAILDVAGHVGIPLLALVIALESMGVPLPGETALVTAGVLASHGDLPIEGVIAAAAGAAIVGDNTGYLIGRHYGRRLLEAAGPFAHHRARIIEIGEPFFARHGPKAVFLGRFVSGLRITAAWMAGITRMPWPIFTFYNAAGGIIWATSFGLIAYYAGHNADKVIRKVGLGGLALVLVVGGAVWLYYRRRSTGDDGDGESAAAATGDHAG